MATLGLVICVLLMLSPVLLTVVMVFWMSENPTGYQILGADGKPLTFDQAVPVVATFERDECSDLLSRFNKARNIENESLEALRVQCIEILHEAHTEKKFGYEVKQPNGCLAVGLFVCAAILLVIGMLIGGIFLLASSS